MSATFTVHQIPTCDIKLFLQRARLEEGYENLKDSIKQHGLRMPIQVRKINDPKYKYELIVGEGRLRAFRDLRIPEIPAIIKQAGEHEIAGLFLAENVIRKDIPWMQKARLMKADADAGLTATQLAKRYSVSKAHVEKCLHIIQRGASNIRLDDFTTDQAYTLTTLPAKGQEIVMETLKQEGHSLDQVTKLVERARNLAAEDKPLSVAALRDSLQSTKDELQSVRDSLKVKRLHWSLGPENLRALLANKKFRSALDVKKINYSKFDNA